MGYFEKAPSQKHLIWDDWQVREKNEHFRTDNISRTFAVLHRQMYIIWYNGESTLRPLDQTDRMNTHSHCSNHSVDGISKL